MRQVLKHAVNQLLKYTDAIEQIIREYRIRHVKKCTPVRKLLVKLDTSRMCSIHFETNYSDLFS